MPVKFPFNITNEEKRIIRSRIIAKYAEWNGHDVFIHADGRVTVSVEEHVIYPKRIYAGRAFEILDGTAL